MSAATMPFSWFQPPAPPAPDVQGWLERMAALPKVMQIARQVRTGASPHEVTYREDKLQVLRYTSDVEKQHATPLLLVFALVNRPYILDLLPGKSVVSHFVNRGFDVFLVDWGCPSDGDRFLRGEDYLERYLHHVVQHVRETTGQDQISLMGYCMGGTLTAMYAALHQELIRNLILMTAPIDFTPTDNLLSIWADPKYFDVDRIVDTFGNAPPWLLQMSFLMLKPVQNLIEKYYGFYEKMTNEKFVEEFFAMETWINDNIPLAGETYREWVKNGYHGNLLVKGEWPIGRRKVRLSDITCPILNLMARDDHLVPCGQSRGFNDLTRSNDRQSIEFPSGHIGLAVSGKAQRDLWPKVCDWLAQRSLPVAARTARGRNGRPAARRRKARRQEA
jgi:polyhydroxyalkanoate synthase